MTGKKLTMGAARALKPGETLRDDYVKGLHLRARQSVKSWHLYYFKSGRIRRPKLGYFPSLTVDGARKAARALLEQIARGEDPSMQRLQARKQPTVLELAERYLDDLSRPKNKKRSLEEKLSKLNTHVLPHIGRLVVKEVTLGDINRLLATVSEKKMMRVTTPTGRTTVKQVGGHTAARHVRTLLHSMFRYAEHSELQWRPRGSNPVIDARTFPERKKRRRHIQSGEWTKLADALARLEVQYPQRVAAIKVALLSGTRITELITAKVSELEGNKIILADHKSDRTDEERTIYLSSQALALIRSVQVETSPWLFGEKLARHHIQTVWEKAREMAGCPDLRAQDLRRTFASAAKSAGKSLETIGELFGHSDADTTMRYAWLFDDAAEAANQATADEIDRLLRCSELVES